MNDRQRREYLRMTREAVSIYTDFVDSCQRLDDFLSDVGEGPNDTENAIIQLHEEERNDLTDEVIDDVMGIDTPEPPRRVGLMRVGEILCIEARYQDGSSNKYYRVRVYREGNQWAAVGEYNRIGQAPNQNPLYRGDNQEDAIEAAYQQIQKKIDKGYEKYSENGVLV